MSLAAVVTLVAVGVAVAFVALALWRVIVNLTYVTNRLDEAYGVVRDIPRLTGPVPEVIASVNGNLRPVRERAERLGR